MRITFHLAFEDYYDAAQVLNASNRRISGVAVIALAVVLGVVWMRVPNVTGGHHHFLLASLLLMLLASFPAVRYLSKLSSARAYRKARGDKAGKEFTVDISEDGIQSLDPPQKDEWSRFSKYSESAGAFILCRETSVYAILPKRAFDREGIDSFRRILGAKLPKH
jgi:hypothetical protein